MQPTSIHKYTNLLKINPLNAEKLEDVKYYTLTTVMDRFPDENQIISYDTYGMDEESHLDTWEYGQFDYKINDLGFRNFKKNEIDIGAFGCSFTFGQGMPNELLWHQLLANELNLKISNYGIPGASIQTCVDVFAIVSKFISMSKAVFLLPSYNRIQLTKYSANNKLGLFSCIPGITSKLGSSYGLNSEDIIKVLPDEEVVKQTKNSLYLLDYLGKIRNIEIHVSSWDKHTYDLLTLLNLENIKLLPVWFTPDTLIWDKARDKRHPGPKHHKYFVNSCLNYFL